jgi:hypothetical protein
LVGASFLPIFSRGGWKSADCSTSVPELAELAGIFEPIAT